MNKNIKIEIENICEKYSITKEELLSIRRDARLVGARAELVKILRDNFGLNFSKIGHILGRDHTTIIYLYKKQKERQSKNNKRKRCLKCHKYFIPSTIDYFKQQKYCSIECRKKSNYLYKLRFEILERDNFTCQYCGASPRKDPNVKLHIDHKYPNKLGGELKKENLITACSICNIGKGDKVFKSILDL